MESKIGLYFGKETSLRNDGIGIRSHGNVDKGEGGEKGKDSRERHEAGGKRDGGKGKESERIDGNGRTEDAGNGTGDLGSASGDGEDEKDGRDRRSKDSQEIKEDLGVDDEEEEEVEEGDVALEKLGENFKHASDQLSGSAFSVKRFDAKRELCEIVDDYEHPLSDVFYIHTNVPGPGADIEDFESVFIGCSCSDKLDASCHNNGQNCFCVARSLGLNYDEKGLLLPEKLFGNLPVFECSSVCSCARTCGNRKVQFGPLPTLSVFECIPSKGTESSKIIESLPLEESIKKSGRAHCVSIKFLGKGLGLKTLKHIPKGAFICEYAGEVIGKQEAVRRWKNDCSLGLPNYILALFEWCSPSPPRDFSDPSTIDTFPTSPCQSKGNGGCAPREICDINEGMNSKNCLVTYIDPTRVGNIGRYANHSCDPNATAVAVRIDCPVPCLCLFAAKDLMPGDEVTFDYAGLDKSSSSYCSEILSLMPKVSESERFLMPFGKLGSPILNRVTKLNDDDSEDASAVEDYAEDFEFKEAKKKCTDLTDGVHSHQTVKNLEVDVPLDYMFKKPKIFVPTQKTSGNTSLSPIVNEHKTKHLIEIERSNKVSHCQPDTEPLLGNENVQINRTPCLCGTNKCRKYLPFSGYWI